ncbi:MAG: hypothetical protein JXR10_14465 [Cyclobacteriaceae bacterium]
MDQFYKYFRWLSLDIVLGAIFFLAYLGKYYGVEISLHVYFALGSAIWLIYTTDHLIDARSVSSPSNERHIFHQQNFKVLTIVGGMVMMLALANVYFLELVIIRNGAVLSAICVGYLLLVYLFKGLWVKEVLVAIAYASGIFLAPISLTTSAGRVDLMLVCQLAFIAFLNLLIFSYYDFQNDQKDGFNSLVIRLGKQKVQVLITFLSAFVIVMSLFNYITTYDSIQLLFGMMTIILAAIYHLPRVFDSAERFRIVGDGVFYLAALFLLF